jgi:uncharacterized membrane protein
MEQILILISLSIMILCFVIMILCFVGLEISNRKYEKARDRYIKWIMSDWTKQI